MDSITHTLFGAIIYGSIKKDGMEKPLKRSLLFTSIIGSLAPDIDVISAFWDSEGMYQMWHRGITHSIFAVPIFALILYLFCRLIWKVRDRRIFYVGLLSVFIHSTSDLFNAWGTGYLEPFSAYRVSFGTIPIVDLFIWFVILIGFILVQWRKLAAHKTFKIVGLIILIHFTLQSIQGAYFYQTKVNQYEKVTLTAGFIPTQFEVYGKTGDLVEVTAVSIWGKNTIVQTIPSDEGADLAYLFEQNPAAKTLYAWSPFVIIEDLPDQIAIYDPRFLTNGNSFLREFAMK